MITTVSGEIIKPKYYLCKPDLHRTTIAHLKEVMHDSQKIALNGLNQLDFSLPIFMNNTRNKKRNKNIDLIKEHFLIRVEKGNDTEYYIIDKVSKIMDDSDSVAVECYSLPYELSFKLIKNYSVVSYNTSQLLVDMLKETIWNIGYVDAQFDLKYRSFDFNGNVKEAIYEIADRFEALVIWDTIKREVSFYNPDTYGMNKGFKTKYGKLMKGVTQELNLDEFCTRLKLFGKDGMSIQAVNPLGSNFIQDFSYFMYPFAMDNSGKIKSHSLYMSDELCVALTKYNKLVESKSGEFSNLLTQKNQLDTTLAAKQTELSTLNTEFNIISDKLDTANGTGQPTGDLIAQKNNKQAQIDAKQAEITSVNNQINSLMSTIQALGNTLKMENNLTANQLIELNQFIIEKELSDENYTDAKDLYEDGKKKFQKIREPKIIVTVSLVNFYEIMTEKHNWDKLSIGDVITVEHEDLGIHIKANVTEINPNYAESDINLTISNAAELSLDDQFMKDHKNNISTSNTVNMNHYKWDDAKATADDVSTILNNTWDAVKRDITAGVNEDVSISRRGIIIRDPKDPKKLLIMQHGQIALSNDNGNTWKTAITPEGVFAERLVGKILLGNKLIISDDDGTFTIEGNLLTIKDKTGTVRIQLGEYQKDKYGLKIVGKSGKVVLDEDGILQTDTIQLADNVDSTHSLKLKFYIDDNTMRIDKVKLNFSLERFRAYSKSVASGGGGSTTSASGGGDLTTTDFEQINLTTTGPQNISGSTQTEGSYTGTGGHNHGISEGTRLATHPTSSGGYVTWVSSGNHSHPISLQSHSHSISMPQHRHGLSIPNHTHQVNIPSHTHDIDYGIFESSYASGVQIKIDGIVRNGTIYYSDSNVDITQWIQTSGWHTIELSSNQLGRINASLFVRTFVGS
ncbi:hypothetical protein GRF59_15255 [Paenibacillus sp. HJL G12]|uniref:Prophage tail endopeptidase domain-containing protein n=1 Tax=Paenibacillus dendrobii TaxID=2691084 RepID=A0A7X3IJA0_9BACL|nr:phage tail spike protein [Paenibacillus dendrobii]MWV44979.1 hypothetical protein [Paenibacillus dendrobii]